jgi:hypothetical protein
LKLKENKKWENFSKKSEIKTILTC